jgi:hypothetical protein
MQYAYGYVSLEPAPFEFELWDRLGCCSFSGVDYGLGTKNRTILSRLHLIFLD